MMVVCEVTECFGHHFRVIIKLTEAKVTAITHITSEAVGMVTVIEYPSIRMATTSRAISWKWCWVSFA